MEMAKNPFVRIDIGKWPDTLFGRSHQRKRYSQENAMSNKWKDLPLYDRPLGKSTEGIDDGRPIVTISDFSICQPSELISETGEPGCWQLEDFTTEEFEGKMLCAAANEPAPPIGMPLNVTGWYAVYVWMMGGDVPKTAPSWDAAFSRSPGPELKLSSDRTFSGRFRTMTQEKMKTPGIEGCFWRYADLTGESLSIRHQGGSVYLGAIRLIPLSTAEVEAVLADRANPDNKRLILKVDEYQKVQLDRRIEHYRHTDVAGWIHGLERVHDLFREGGSVMLQDFKEGCREIGAECYVCDRPALWSSIDFVHSPRYRWFDHHPEYHCKERDGSDTFHCSYAEKAVQDYMLKRARAVAKTGPDGFGFFFNRDPGIVLFEPAAMKGFAEKHGVDPLTLPEDDDRILDWRAEIITGFMRRVRELLDEVAKKKNFQRIKMVHVILGSKGANRRWSFDIAQWIEEGLADVILTYPWGDYPEWMLTQTIEPDIEYYASLVKDTQCKLYSMWLRWETEDARMDTYFQKAAHHYAAGAHGISAWDELGVKYAFTADRWLRLGHRDRLAEWAENDFPVPPFLRLVTRGGKTVLRFPPGIGG